MEHIGLHDEFERHRSRIWENGPGAKTSVLVLMGAALGGSIGAALLISQRLAWDAARAETVGVLLLAALLLASLAMSVIIYEISCPRRPNHLIRRPDEDATVSDSGLNPD